MTPEEFQELKNKFGADNPAIILVETVGFEKVHYDCALKHCEVAAEEVSIEEMLMQHCRDFIKENKIFTTETIYQASRVSDNSLRFIEGICSLLGYHTEEKETL